MKTFEQRFVEQACALVGQPYVWGANGDTLWVSPEEGLKNIVAHLGPNPYGIDLAFDCVGLIKYACLKAGGPDLRATHNARTLYDVMPDSRPLVNPITQEKPETFRGSPAYYLFFYGDPVIHVALAHGLWVLEAAGGNAMTVNWATAHANGAKVRCGLPRRYDYRGSRALYDLQFVKP